VIEVFEDFQFNGIAGHLAASSLRPRMLPNLRENRARRNEKLLTICLLTPNILG
jgi:hypothetical protein